jgi:N-acetylglucosamine-6-sulfatase
VTLPAVLLGVLAVLVGLLVTTARSPDVGASGTATVQAVEPQVVLSRRPNIVLIMVDDMRDDDLRYMPRTRRLIGGSGVRFVNALSPHPLCCPARASHLTGLYTHNHGVYTVQPPYGFSALDDRSTLATWLHDAGYATVYLSKYLNGYGWMPEPGRRQGSSTGYVPPGWDQWLASIDGGLPESHPDHGQTYHFYDTTLSVDGQGFRNFEGRYQTETASSPSGSSVAARPRSGPTSSRPATPHRTAGGRGSPTTRR